MGLKTFFKNWLSKKTDSEGEVNGIDFNRAQKDADAFVSVLKYLELKISILT